MLRGWGWTASRVVAVGLTSVFIGSSAQLWTDASIRLGWAPTYGQAFLAIDMLVERYGIESLNTYQRRFSTDADALSHWPSVFPITSSEFVRQFRARLEQLGGTGPRGTLAVADR